MKKLITFTLLTGVLFGCVAKQDTTPTGPADLKRQAESKAVSVESLQTAATMGAGRAVDTLPESPAKSAAKGELKVALTGRPAPAPVDLAGSFARVDAQIAGDTEGAEKARSDTVATLETLILDRDKALAEYATRQADSEKLVASLKTQLQEAKDATAKRVQFWFSLILRVGAGIVGAIAASRVYGAFATGTEIFKALKGSLVLIALSAGAFLLSWAVAQWWFYWACAGIVACVALVVGRSAYKEQTTKGTLAKMVSEIETNKVFDAAGNPISSTVDLVKLRGDMDRAEKKIVKALRGEKAKASI